MFQSNNNNNKGKVPYYRPVVKGGGITDNPLKWRHNGRDGVSNHQPHDCLLSRLFRHRSKKTSKLRVTGLCAGNSPVTHPVNSPHKRPVTRKIFPFDDVIVCGFHRSGNTEMSWSHRVKYTPYCYLDSYKPTAVIWHLVWYINIFPMETISKYGL